MAHKADKITHAQRVEVVYRMICDGWTAPQIVQNVADQWGVKERQAYGYVKSARLRMHKDAETLRSVALDEAIASRKHLQLRTHDEKVKADMLKDLAKLLGLYPAEKREITGKDGGPVAVQVFDYDNFGAAFGGLVGGHGTDDAAPDGHRESLDTAAADGQAGGVPGPAES